MLRIFVLTRFDCTEKVDMHFIHNTTNKNSRKAAPLLRKCFPHGWLPNFKTFMCLHQLVSCVKSDSFLFPVQMQFMHCQKNSCRTRNSGCNGKSAKCKHTSCGALSLVSHNLPYCNFWRRKVSTHTIFNMPKNWLQ